MKRAWIVLLVTALAALPYVAAQQRTITPYEQQRAAAEKAFAEQSYAIAHRLYAALRDVPDAETRWVAFRLADTSWRAGAASDQSDDTLLQRARVELEQLIAAIDVPHDRLWVEVNESLGDWHHARGGYHGGGASPYYMAALDWWGRSDDIALARDRYLKIVWKVTGGVDHPRYAYNVHILPLEVLRNAVTIAVTAEDKSNANLLLARRLVVERVTPENQEATRRAFESAIESTGTTRYDDALFEYAVWEETRGRLEEVALNRWRLSADYGRAVALYQRFLAAFREGTSDRWPEARQRLASIVEPSLNVVTHSAFLPGEDASFILATRNIESVELTLSRISLLSEYAPSKAEHVDRPQDSLRKLNGELVRRWRHVVEGSADHHPRSEKIEAGQKLAAGTYRIEARSARQVSSELLFVTDIVLVTKTTPSSMMTWVTDALTGAPRADASVRVIALGNARTLSDSTIKTGADGLARFPLPRNGSHARLAVVGRSGQSEAMALDYYYAGASSTASRWIVYVLTDRPAYRPEDTVEWKFTARRRDVNGYTTPSGDSMSYEVTDPRGNMVKQGSVRLNRFGSAWGSLPLDATMPLGMYQVTFKNAAGNGIDSTQFFRLEEYKLPEFKVDVELPTEAGKQKLYRTGDSVTARVKAEYYFGGPVANAEVAITVEEQNFHPFWPRPREFGWYFHDRGNDYGRYGGRTVKSETVRTDADGIASVTFDTPVDGGNLQYVITANVTDSSRRQVTGSGSVRVSRQGYFVTASVDHFIYQPGERAVVRFKANDANGTPVRVQGEVVVTRDEWFEVWITDEGNTLRGRDASRMRDKLGETEFSRKYRLHRSGYEHEKITTQKLDTNADGEALYEFTIPREGFYRFAWSSPDRREGSRFSSPVTAETTIWAARDATTLIGYRHEGIEILIDKDTVKSGETAPVMIVARDPGTHVLFTVEAEEILEARVVEVQGNVRVVHLRIEPRFIPNVFLSASAVRHGRLLGDSKELVVPPREQFLQVDVKSDRSELEPGQDGSFTVTARDYEGKPVESEVTIAVRDASVFAIQGDLAADPRQRFYGEKRHNAVRLNSSLQFRSFANYEEALQKKERRERDGRGDLYVDDAMQEMKQSAADAELGSATGAVAETITVTASSPVMAQAANIAPPPAPPPPPAPEGEPMQGTAITVRTDFRTTILWKPDLATDSSGKAVVTVTYPDSTTSWNVAATAFTTDTKLGSASTSVRTRKPLIARLQLPRFLVVGDVVTISGVLNNNTDAAISVRPQLKVEGASLADATAPGSVTVPAQRDARVDYRVRAEKAGMATFTLSASGSSSDAMELSIPIVEHGIEKLIAASGKMREESVRIGMQLAARRPGSTTMAVQVTPSIAVTMLDALPYLIEFPYGCTEQTMSRFLPAVIVAKTLSEVGVKPADIERKIFGGVEPATAGKTHRDVSRSSILRLDAVTERGLDRLYDFQHGDGGWGWWKDGSSDLHMTAYVVWGMTLAKSGGVPVRDQVLSRGAEYLTRHVVEFEESPAEQAWVLHALAEYRALTRSTATPAETRAMDSVFGKRGKLAPYARALTALAAHRYGQAERAALLLRNLENDVKTDDAPDASVVIRTGGRGDASVMATAHWGEEYGWWRWQDGAVESTAMALRALVTIDPKHRLVEPAMNWLVKNRRGAQWNNTKDTALSVLALNEYLQQTKELGGDVSFEISVNGSSIGKKNVTRAEMIAAPSEFVIDPALLRDSNEVVITRTGGTAPIYFAVEATYFSLEEPVTAAGNELFVKRDYYRIVSRPTLLAGYVDERVLLRDGDTVKSGDRIDVVATVEVKNDYQYLMFEDLKPAGFEAIALQSGGSSYAEKLKLTGVEKINGTREAERERRDVSRTQWLYQELRDRKIVTFADRLSQGIWRFNYQLRAQTPGTFHALPMLGQAMYVPELRGNSNEVRVTVED